MPALQAHSSSSRGAAWPELPGSTSGVNPRNQGVISRQFKGKKNFVMDRRTNEGWKDKRDSQNSDVDVYKNRKSFR